MYLRYFKTDREPKNADGVLFNSSISNSNDLCGKVYILFCLKVPEFREACRIPLSKPLNCVFIYAVRLSDNGCNHLTVLPRYFFLPFCLGPSLYFITTDDYSKNPEVARPFWIFAY